MLVTCKSGVDTVKLPSQQTTGHDSLLLSLDTNHGRCGRQLFRMSCFVSCVVAPEKNRPVLLFKRFSLSVASPTPRLHPSKGSFCKCLKL